MRQFIYFILLLLIIGCANNAPINKEAHSVSTEDFYTEEELSPIALKDAYTMLISEKLQDYLDKQILAEQHPEFETKDNVVLFNTENAKEIRQIKFIGQPKIISDSITKIITQVHFDNTRTDTIISYIKTATAMIDGVKFKTSKATFEKIKSSIRND